MKTTGGRLAAGMTRLRADERLLVICGSTVLVMAGQGVVGPVLPLFARDFGVGAAVVGLTFTAFGLARLLLNIPAGLWADRRGRRFLLVGGPLVTSVGMIGSGLAPSIWVLLVWRPVAGAGSALYMTGAQIYLIDIAEPHQRGRYIATNQGALLVGVSAGPAIGGVLADGLGLRAPFLVVGGAAVLTAVYGWYRLPETRDREAAEAAATDAPIDRATRRAFFRSREFVAIGLVATAVFSVRGSRQALVPLYADDAFGLSASRIGLVFTTIGLVGLVLIGPAGWAVDRFGRKALIVPTGYIAAVGVVASALAPTVELFIGGLLLSAVGTGISGPAPAAFVADIAPEQLRGSAMGAYRAWGDLGIVLSPPLSGALADLTSLPLALAANGLLLGLAATMFLGVRESSRDPVPRGAGVVPPPGSSGCGAVPPPVPRGAEPSEPAMTEPGARSSGTPAGAPIALQIAVRVERDDPPTAAQAATAAALATIALLDDPRRDPGGPWHEAVERWTGGPIRKIVRRARGAAWTRAQAVDGVTVGLDRPGTGPPVEARAFVPGPVDRVPRPVARLQIQAGPLDEPARTAALDGGEAGLLVAVSPEVEMSWGKRAAQCAHAVQRAWEAATAERRASWDRAGRPIAVIHPEGPLWAQLVEGAEVSIRDGGFTEIPAGTLTAVTRWIGRAGDEAPR